MGALYPRELSEGAYSDVKCPLKRTIRIILAYIGLYGLTHSGVGPGGFMGDENDLALACCTAFPFAFFGFERLKGIKQLLAGALMMLFAASIVFSFSRGGFVGLAAASFACFMFSNHKVRSLAVVALAVVLFFAFASAKYVDEIRSISDTSDGTAETRRFLWETAYNMWKDNIVIGVGGGGFSFQVAPYQPTGGQYDDPSYQFRSWSGTTVHSMYFQLLSEMGTVGVILVVSLLVYYFRLLKALRRDLAKLTQKRDPLRREAEMYAGALAAGMVGYLVPGLFLSVLYYPFPWYLSALSVAPDRGVRGELALRAAKQTPATTRTA